MHYEKDRQIPDLRESDLISFDRSELGALSLESIIQRCTVILHFVRRNCYEDSSHKMKEER